jgi:hypothetical protein
MTRETLYVAMTRGRQANTAYTTTDAPDSEAHHDVAPTSGRQILVRILGRVGAEASATRQTVVEQDRWASIAQLAAEYDTIAAAAQHARWTQLIRNSGLTGEEVEQAIASAAFGPLTAALRRADAHGLDPERVLPELVAVQPLDDAADTAAVLHHRITSVTRRQQHNPHARPPDLIVGLIPAATGPMTADMRTALQERQQLIQQRAIELLRAAIANDEPWTRQIGTPPHDLERRRAWTRQAATVAAYRDRYLITAPNPVGGSTTSDIQQIDAAAAADAVRNAVAISHSPPLAPVSISRHPPTRPWQGPPM